MLAEEIKAFVKDKMPELDEPEVFLPDINQVDVANRWTSGATSNLMITPVPFSASISNMGVAILYDIVNNRMGEDFFMERSYFPEKKMLRHMKKAGVPLFGKETFHQARDFDVVSFSAYFALQYYGFPELFDLMDIPWESKDRGDSLTEYPLMVMGGIQCYNAEPIAPMFDIIYVGEGEENWPALLKLFRECKAAGTSKHDFLVRAAKEIQGIMVPQFYEYEYYPADDPTHSNQIKAIKVIEDGVPERVAKAVIDFKNTPILTKTLVGNSEGGDMSVGAVYIANSCGNLCSFAVDGNALVQTPDGFKKLKDMKAGGKIKGYHEMREIKTLNNLGLRDSIKITTRNGYELTVDREHPVELVSKDGSFHEVLAKDLEIGDYIPVSLEDCGVFPDKEIPISFEDSEYNEEEYERKGWLKPSSVNLPKTFNKDLGFLVGFIAGDGTIRYDRDTCILHTVSNAPEVAARLKGIMDPILGKDKSLRLIHETTLTEDERYDATDVLDYQVDSRFFVRWLKSLGLKHSCYDVKVPDIIWNSPKEVICEFLKGLFEADGTVSKEGTVSFVTASKTLAYDVQQLFSGLGICSDVIPRKTNVNPSYVVVIVGVNSRLNYFNLISFESKRKIKRLSERIEKAEGSPVYQARKRDYHAVEIVNLEETSAEVYEINVDGDHLFMVNGVLTHNCQGSAISLPYRERDLDDIKKATDELIKNTGTIDITP